MFTHGQQPIPTPQEIIDQYSRYDDSEHFPSRECVRDDIACDKTIE